MFNDLPYNPNILQQYDLRLLSYETGVSNIHVKISTLGKLKYFDVLFIILFYFSEPRILVEIIEHVLSRQVTASQAIL